MARPDTLYVSDMDGTLLGSDSRISARSGRLINDLEDAGIHFTVATARTPASVVPLMAGTETRTEAIVMTGAACWDWVQGCFTDIHTIPTGHVQAILEICRRSHIHPFVYVLAGDGRTLDVYHEAHTLSKAEQGFYLERCKLTLKRFHLAKPLPEADCDRTLLFYAMGLAESILPVADELRRTTDLAISCYPDIFNPTLANLEILAPGVSKAAAIRRVADRCGAKRIVVFGDNLNDLPMFAIADTAVAVANAQPQVKNAADVVIGANFTDAVPEWIITD